MKKDKTKHNKKTQLVFFLFIILSFIMWILGFLTSDLLNLNNIWFLQQIEILIGMLLLISVIYFFVLPEKFIIGGLESNLIFLDQIFFFDKKNQKQKYFFSQNNKIIIIRSLILLFAVFNALKEMPNATKILISSVIFSVLFSFILKLFNHYNIKQNLILRKFPEFIQKNIYLRLFVSSIITSLTLGITCGAIFKNHYSTAGTEVIFMYVAHLYKWPLSIILFIIDGSAILLSFIMNLSRSIKKNNKKNINNKKNSSNTKNVVIKYFFSILIFIITISIIAFRTSKKI
ncbi:YitT family protein [Candidatus Phytoplasma sp. AldY-WA1]|uniref:YitT family protein n=1 Tax=Candidatus Phytoplasma sp. AldY-WA1 TaxID=2852100 RepID=UPI00254F199F|nr:YitT family protein [Candidatus Phytoplasma sp. AldY-WA1]